MTFRLADQVQVRQESWGLLFYSQTQHRMVFVKSGDLLNPGHFDGTWAFDAVIADIVARRKASVENITGTIRKLTNNLVMNEMVINELL